jgi:hypothetical protein
VLRSLFLSLFLPALFAGPVAIYQNNVTDTGFVDSFTTNSLLAGGDLIQFAPDTPRYLVVASTGFWNLSSTVGGTVDVTLDLWSVVGGLPGGNLYSGTLSSVNAAANSFVIADFNPNITVPDDIIWTLSFSNPSNPLIEFGLPAFDPPTIGSSDNTFVIWSTSPGVFTQASFPDSANYYFEAQATPEPATFVLCGATLLLLGWRLRHRAAPALAVVIVAAGVAQAQPVPAQLAAARQNAANFAFNEVATFRAQQGCVSCHKAQALFFVGQAKKAGSALPVTGAYENLVNQMLVRQVGDGRYQFETPGSYEETLTWGYLAAIGSFVEGEPSSALRPAALASMKRAVDWMLLRRRTYVFNDSLLFGGVTLRYWADDGVGGQSLMSYPYSHNDTPATSFMCYAMKVLLANHPSLTPTEISTYNAALSSAADTLEAIVVRSLPSEFLYGSTYMRALALFGMAQAGRTASNNTTAAGLSTTIMNSLGANPYWLDYTGNPVTASYNTGMALFALSASGITMRTDSRLIPPVNTLLSQQTGGGNWPPVAYSVGFTTGTAGLVTLLKPPASITLSGLSHSYDGTAKSATAITSPSGLPHAIFYSPSSPPLAAGAYTATANISDAAYDAVPATGTLNIAKASLSATANSASRFFGQANPPLTGSLLGNLPADNITATYTTSASPASAPGGYPITPVLADPLGRLGNYNVTLNSGTLTVNPLYTVTTNVSPAGAGVVSPDIGSFFGPTQFSAYPIGGCWTFDRWSGDASGTSSPFLLDVTGNKSITANFLTKTAEDVTALMTITVGGARLNRVTGVTTQQISVRNNSNRTLEFLQLVFSGLNATSVFALSGPTGTTQCVAPAGSYYRQLSISMPPGVTSLVTVSFTQTGPGALSYTPKAFVLGPLGPSGFKI